MVSFGHLFRLRLRFGGVVSTGGGVTNIRENKDGPV